MVFSGKIYDQVKENLDTYLFGFDRSQLDVSLLKGKSPSKLLSCLTVCRGNQTRWCKHKAEQGREVDAVIGSSVLAQSRHSWSP